MVWLGVSDPTWKEAFQLTKIVLRAGVPRPVAPCTLGLMRAH